MLITILIASYNAEGSIARAVTSALEQDFSPNDREVLVVNDGSTDKTLTVLKQFESRIRIINRSHSGLAKTCNTGLAEARGAYFVRLDADDRLAPSALSTLFANKGNAGCVYSDHYEEYPDGTHKTVSLADFNIFQTIACGVLFSTETANRVGGYDDLLFEEYDFFIRYLQANPRTVYVPQALYYYSRHGAGMTDQLSYLEKGWKQLIQKWGEPQLATWDYKRVYNQTCKQ